MVEIINKYNYLGTYSRGVFEKESGIDYCGDCIKYAKKDCKYPQQSAEDSLAPEHCFIKKSLEAKTK